MGKVIAVILIILALLIAAIAIFHIVHYRMFCRYRKEPGKSHCGKCGHREICKKYHFKNEK